MLSLTDFKKQRIQMLMAENNVDALIATLPENIYYMTGYESIGHKILHSTQIFALYNLKADSISLVIPRAEIPTAIERFPDLNMTPYGTFFYAYTPGVPGLDRIKSITEKSEASVWQGLVQALKASQISKSRVGVDESRISIQLWKQLETEFPEIEFIPAMGIFSKIRMIKHQCEIELLEKSAEIAEESMIKALLNLKVGMSEYEIGRQYITEVTKRNADPFFNVVTVDERTPLSDTINTDKKVLDGSIIRVDFGCIYQGYRSDLARTAVVGKSSSKLEEYYSAILKGEEEAIAQIKPGVISEDIFDIAVDVTRKVGISHYERHHCGHGIGLEV
ncbi:MAG: Xaa-Pro peptidase family protein, partial [Tepidanaerobacteraceae bacterium]|nr:Xaa-Pro peptidase family protein [Tepidanaerobacteraceae bacterium]